MLIKYATMKSLCIIKYANVSFSITAYTFQAKKNTQRLVQ